MSAPDSRALDSDIAGLEDRLVEFFDVHYARMTRLAGLICHDGIGSEDAVQAAMEQAWKRRRALRDQRSMRSWLDRIVVREAIRLNRRPWWRRERAPVDDHALSSADPSVEVNPLRVALAEAFRTLPVEQRAVVALHLHLGYTVAETADLMGASIETTRSRLRLARRRLRRELAEDES